MTSQEVAELKKAGTRMVEAAFAAHLGDRSPMEITFTDVFKEKESDPFAYFEGIVRNRQKGDFTFKGNLSLTKGRARKGEIILKGSAIEIYIPFNHDSAESEASVEEVTV